MVRLEDVQEVAAPVLTHRVITTFAAQARRHRCQGDRAPIGRGDERRAVDTRRASGAPCRAAWSMACLSCSQPINPTTSSRSDVLSRLAGVPLFARRPMQGQRLGPASQPAPRVERRVRRVSQVRAGRRPAATRLAGLRPDRPLLRQGVRGRHELALLPRARYQRLDGLRLHRHDQDRVRPQTRRLRSAIWPAQQGDAVGLACVADGIVHNMPPRRNPAHLRLRASTCWSRCTPAEAKRSWCRGAARTGRDDSPAGAGDHRFRSVRRARTILRGCFRALAFRKHDVAAFHLLDPLELQFDFHRPMRFLDMEGGPADLCRAERNRRSLSQGTCSSIWINCRTSCWKRPSTITASASTRDYEQTLMRFLVGPDSSEACDEFSAAVAAGRVCRWSRCRSSST